MTLNLQVGTLLLMFLLPYAVGAQSRTACRHCRTIRPGSADAAILRSLPTAHNRLAIVIDEQFQSPPDTHYWSTRLLYNDPNDLLPPPDFDLLQHESGKLHLVHKKSGLFGADKRPLWYGGALHTRTDPRGGALGPGRYEVTFRMPPVPGFQGAAWLFGWAGEIDLIELNGCNPTVWQSDAHNGGYGPNHVHDAILHDSPSWSDAPQTIGLTWSNDSLEWFLNGRSVRVVHKYYKRVKRKWVGLTVSEAQRMLDAGEKVFGNLIFPNPYNRADLIINGYIKYNKPVPCGIFSGMPEAAADSFALDVYAIKVWQPTEFELIGPDSIRLDKTAHFAIHGMNKTHLVNTQFAAGVQLVRHTPARFKVTNGVEVQTAPVELELKGVATGTWVLDVWIAPEGLCSFPTRLRKPVVIY